MDPQHDAGWNVPIFLNGFVVAVVRVKAATARQAQAKAREKCPNETVHAFGKPKRV